jgi:cbb3-type cytochrome oxidase subunit 3
MSVANEAFLTLVIAVFLIFGLTIAYGSRQQSRLEKERNRDRK